MELFSNSFGTLLSEGKTKRVHQLSSDSSKVLILSKDRITAGDGLKAHEMKGKAVLSTKTNCALFEFLNACHVPTHFVSRVSTTWPEAEKVFVANKCQMIPIEWVSRRVATGSFLKRHPHVREGTRFAPPKLETFFKDDANHDPFWSEETMVGAGLEVGGLKIEAKHVTQMLRLTRLVFELIERVWMKRRFALIDMKIEFGVFDGQIVVADVIDNDSWRLWPEGNKDLMLDKQIYRNLNNDDIDDKAIEKVKNSFEIVAEETQKLFSRMVTEPSGHVVVLLGSQSDSAHAQKITEALHKFGVNDVRVVVTSAHKTTSTTLQVVADVTQSPDLKAIIAVAGMSNGLGPVVAGNSSVPVINSPPNLNPETLLLDVWSSLRMPSGVGVSTVLGAENSALGAALIVGNDSPLVWGTIRTNQTLNEIKTLFINV